MACLESNFVIFFVNLSGSKLLFYIIHYGACFLMHLSFLFLSTGVL